MEMDPLKVPAFMRKKMVRRPKASASYKASKPIEMVKPTKIRIPKRLQSTPSLPADPIKIRIPKRLQTTSYLPADPIKIRIPKRLRKEMASKLPADPAPTRLNFPTDPTPTRSSSRTTNLILVGVITQYFAKINVASIKLGMDVEVGDKLQLEGENGSFKQVIQSMQIDRKNVEIAGRNQEIGIKVNKKVKVGELVYVVR